MNITVKVTKRFLFRISLLLIVVVLGASFLNSKSRVKADESPFLSHIVGSNINFGYLAPANAVHDNTGKDLIDLAHDMGLNVLRISTWGTEDPQTHLSKYSKADWDAVLSKMASYNIKAIIAIHNAAYNANDVYNDNYLPFVSDLLITKGLATNPDVYSVDLANETLLVDSNIAKLQQAHDLIKAANPDMLTTVGGWKIMQTSSCPPLYGNGTWCWNDPADAWKVSPFSDYYSGHHYLYDKFVGYVGCVAGTTGTPQNDPQDPRFPDPVAHTYAFIQKIRQVVNDNKPIVLEEFGADNSDICNDQKTLIPTSQQASIYQGVTQAFDTYSSSLNFTGILNWSLYQACDYQSGWATAKKVNANDPSNCNAGTFTLFPAGEVYKQYALSSTSTSTPTPTATPSPSPTPLPNEIINPSFEVSGSNWLAPWSFAVRTGAAATISQDNTTSNDGTNSALINVTTSSTDWYVQLKQSQLSFTAGVPITLKYWAKASTPRAIRVVIQQGYGAYSTYTQKTVTLSTTWQQYTLTYTPSVNESNALLAFNVANAVGQVWFDNVLLQ